MEKLKGLRQYKKYYVEKYEVIGNIFDNPELLEVR